MIKYLNVALILMINVHLFQITKEKSLMHRHASQFLTFLK